MESMDKLVCWVRVLKGPLGISKEGKRTKNQGSCGGVSASVEELNKFGVTQRFVFENE